MMIDETEENFVSLFKGRTDAYGAWGGGMVSLADNSHDYINECFANHLHDGPYIGVYPVTDDNTTGWGCIDIDGKDHQRVDALIDGGKFTDWDAMWKIAAELQDVLYYKDCTSWIERTANGFHLWVFAEERVPAETMRHALLVVCEVAEYKPKEVNPKQLAVSAAKPFGSYVRLPYPGALCTTGYTDTGTMTGDRFVVDEDGRPMTVQEFSRTAMASRVPVGTLEAMSTLWVGPPSRQVGVLTDGATDEDFRMLEPILPPVVALIFADGPLGDRSSALVKAALILRDDGWQAQAVFTILKALDARLGKFVDRPDCDDRLLDIMSKVGFA